MLGQNDNINLEVHEKKKIFLGFYGIVFLIILAAIIAMGYYYTNSIDYFAQRKVTGKNNLRTMPDTSMTSADIPAIKGAISPPVDLSKLQTSTPEQINKGKELYTTNCTGCHGAEGKGDGIAGVAMNPKPRNFADLNEWKNGIKPSDMYKTLQEGIPATGMPAFANLSPEDRFSIIHFVRSLNPELPAATPEELAALDKAYSLSSGVKAPNQIPVKTAMQKLIEESSANTESIKKSVDLIKNDTTQGAVIFKKISGDTERAVMTLNSNRQWLNNESDMIMIMSTGTPANGFTGVNQLSKEEITLLHTYLKNLFSSNFNIQQQG